MLTDQRILTNGYRAYLGGDDFGYIGFYRWALVLFQTNKRRCGKCKQCGERIEAGAGVYHEQYRNNGYVHLECAKEMIEKYGNKGFTVSILENLQAVEFNPPKYTAQEVVEAIRVSDTKRLM